jgi:hypothetical protein
VNTQAVYVGSFCDSIPVEHYQIVHICGGDARIYHREQLESRLGPIGAYLGHRRVDMGNPGLNGLFLRDRSQKGGGMATVTCYRYNWFFPEGLPPGTDYYGYIIWGSAPVQILEGTSTITATPSDLGARLTIMDTSIKGTGPGTTTVEFTLRNTSSVNTVRYWTIFLSIVRP